MPTRGFGTLEWANVGGILQMRFSTRELLVDENGDVLWVDAVRLVEETADSVGLGSGPIGHSRQ